MRAQRIGHDQQVTELHLGACFHALDRRPVEARHVSQGFLGHVEVQSPDADAISGGPAGVEDPLRVVGGHPVNALSIMV